jgi:Xaa-Pro aminopeptidase
VVLFADHLNRADGCGSGVGATCDVDDLARQLTRQHGSGDDGGTNLVGHGLSGCLCVVLVL